MKFEDFSEVISFPPPRAGVVYVLYCVLGQKPTPFYVGQTKRFIHRMEDYVWADFTAQTDFKVGEAIRYFKSENIEVVVAPQESTTPIPDELSLIAELDSMGSRLLNHLSGYDYRKANEEDERKRVRDFCIE